jgi:hypothetical protein
MKIRLSLLLAAFLFGYTSARQSGYINKSLKWPTMPIRVCWDGHEMVSLGANNSIIRTNVSVEQGIVEQAIANTWEYYGVVNFDWRYSKGVDCGIIIQLMYETEHTVGHGKELGDYVKSTNGLSPNMYLDFSSEPKNLKERYPNWSTLTSVQKSNLRTAWIKRAAVHEFGHALGFYHEHKRTDKDIVGSNDPDGTRDGDREKITPTVTVTGYYDLYSIMNYYAKEKYAGEPNFTLSCGDVAAIRSLYGSNLARVDVAPCCTEEKIKLLGKTPDWPEKYTALSCPQPSATNPGGINVMPQVPPVNSGKSLLTSDGIPQPEPNAQYSDDGGAEFGWEIEEKSQNNAPGYQFTFYVKPGQVIYGGNISLSSNGDNYTLGRLTGGVVNPSNSGEYRSSADGSQIAKASMWFPKGSGLFDATTGEFYKEFNSLPDNTPWWQVTKIGNVYRLNTCYVLFTISGITGGPFGGNLPYRPFTLAKFSPFIGTAISNSLVNIPSKRVGGQITIPAFKMGQSEITQEVYWYVMGRKPSARISSNPLLPAEGMTFYDAVLFCNRLSEMEGLESAYTYTRAYFRNLSLKNSNMFDGMCYFISGLQVDTSKNGYRVPTPEEWSWAMLARNSTRFYWGDGTIWSSESFPYSWGANTPGYPNNTRQPMPVGTRQPNNWRLYDMVGNVAEFTWYFDGTQVVIPAKIGGSYYDSEELRTGINMGWAVNTYNPQGNFYNVGLRILRRSRDISLVPIYNLLLH